MNLRYDQAIAAVILALSVVSLFLWVQVNQKSPLERSMILFFGSKPESSENDAEPAAPLHSKRSLSWFRFSLGLFLSSVVYLYLAD